MASAKRRAPEEAEALPAERDYCTVEEWDGIRRSGLISGDHASYVRAMAGLLEMPFIGEAPHALDLVIGAFSKTLGFLPVLTLMRAALAAGHSYEMARLLEAFTPACGATGAAAIRSFKELMSMAATRWGYTSRFFDLVGSGQNVAMLQELLIWMLARLGVATPAPAPGLSYVQAVAVCRNVYAGMDYDAAVTLARPPGGCRGREEGCCQKARARERCGCGCARKGRKGHGR